MTEAEEGLPYTIAMRWTLLTAALGLLLAAGADAHHGSAEYHVDREVTVSGTVSAFRWVNPHLRVVLTTGAPEGKPQQLDCEGPPLTWAAQQGWSATTLRPGERVSLVMYPAKQEGRGGLIKRIERSNGEVLSVSRPWLDGR
jgi:hypothetical protein